MAVCKVESHMTSAEALAQGVDLWGYIGHNVADYMAECVAEKCQVSQATVGTVQFADEFSRAVRAHLTKVTLECIDKDPHRPAPPRARARQRATLAALARESAHKQLSVTSCAVSCAACGGRVRAKHARKFLVAPCHVAMLKGSILVPERAMVGHQEVRPSHLPAYMPALGMHWCVRCGCIARETAKSLAAVCPGFLNKYGKQCVSRLSKGLLPGASAQARLLLGSS